MALLTAKQYAKELQGKGKSDFEIAGGLNRAGFDNGEDELGKPKRFSMKDIPTLLSGQDAADKAVEAAMQDTSRALLTKKDEAEALDSFREDGQFQAIGGKASKHAHRS